MAHYLLMKATLKYPVQWLLVILLCVYSQVLTFDFVNLDDPSHLDNNPHYSPLSTKSYLHFWKAPHFLYMPVTYSVWTLGVLLSPPTAENPPRGITGEPREFRFSAPVFHFFTLFFHLVSVLFVFYCLTLFSSDTWVCFFGALLFGLHPLQVEAVAWISALKDTLSGAFFFSALYFYFQKNRYSLSLVLYLLGLCSKPSVVVLPLILFVLAIGYFKRDWKAELKKLSPFVYFTVPILWMTVKVQATETLHFKAPSFFEKCLVALDAIGFYVGKILVPFDLAVDYGRTPAYALTHTPVYLTAASVFIGFSLLFYYLYKENKKLESFGLLFALICILPVLGFKPFSFQTTSTVSDRFLYLALFGLVLALLPGLKVILLSSQNRFLVGALLLLFSVRTVDQLKFWKNTVTMFERAIEVNPRSWLSYNNLGSYYERRNELTKALAYYRKAASHDRQGIFYNNIATVCYLQRDYYCSIEAFKTALDINPLSTIDRNGLAATYLAMGEKKKAREEFQNVLALDPSFIQAQIGINMASK